MCYLYTLKVVSSSMKEGSVWWIYYEQYTCIYCMGFKL